MDYFVRRAAKKQGLKVVYFQNLHNYWFMCIKNKLGDVVPLTVEKTKTSSKKQKEFIRGVFLVESGKHPSFNGTLPDRRCYAEQKMEVPAGTGNILLDV